MHFHVYSALVLGLLAVHISLSMGIQVDIPGRCPNVCKTDVESVFFGCVNEIEKGCALSLCSSRETSVKCGLKSGVPDEIFTGEEVRISDFRVSRTMRTDIVISGLLPKIDVYLLVDGTGSMGSAIAALRSGFLRLQEALKETGDFAFGVGVFRDETELDMGFRNLQGITTDVDAVKEQVDTLRSRGGDDTEEANLVALYKIATGDFANWREGASRVILLFGDAVGHEPTCFDDVILNRGVVTRVLKDNDITVEAVGTQFATLNAATTQFGCGSGRAGRGQTTAIATDTGGGVARLENDNARSVISTFSEVLGSTNTVVDLAESTCENGLTFTFEPSLPGALRAGQKLTTTLRLRRRVCRRGTFQCTMRFGSGESVSEPITWKVTDPLGCPS